MYEPEPEHDAYLQVPVPMPDNEPAWQSTNSDTNGAKHEQGNGTAPASNGLLGAFTSLIQRIVPDDVNASGNEPLPPPYKDPPPRRVSYGDLGSQTGSVAVGGQSRERHTGSVSPQQSGSTSQAPAAENPAPGWFGNWGRLFGYQEPEDEPNRQPYDTAMATRDDQIGPPATASNGDALARMNGSDSAEGDGWHMANGEDPTENTDEPRRRVSTWDKMVKVKSGFRNITALPGLGGGAKANCSGFCCAVLQGVPNIGKGCMNLYIEKVLGGCPCCCACIYLLACVAFIGVGIVLYPMKLETDFGAFTKTDTNSSLLHDTFLEAYGERADVESRRLQTENGRSHGELLAGSRRLASGGNSLYANYDFFIAYEMRDEQKGSIFNKQVMTGVLAFERELFNLPGWKRLCHQVDADETSTRNAEFELNARLCNPGISLINYMLPSLEIAEGSIVPSTIAFNGSGGDSVPLDTTLRLVEQAGLKEMVLPRGFDESATGGTRMFRTIFRFKKYCCTSTEPQSVMTSFIKTSKEEWLAFVEDDLLPKLQEVNADEERLLVKVFYGGTEFTALEVMQTLMGDSLLAAGGMGFVLLYILFHTRSLVLSVAALFLIILAIPLSYVIFAALVGGITMSIASFLSLFLVVGLGSDVVFVYTDFWHQSDRYKNREMDKLVWTMIYGGKASLATTVTTALSFFANLASVLRPLREFGVFMGLCVMSVWMLLTLIYVPLCAIDSRLFSASKQNSFGLRLSYSEVNKSSSGRILVLLAYHVSRWRRCALVLTFVLWAGSLALSITRVELETSVPNIFPEDHNQNHGVKVFEEFAALGDVIGPFYIAPPASQEVCTEHVFRPDDSKECSLFWCEVDSLIQVPAKGTCKCYHRPKCATKNVETRMVGEKSLITAAIKQRAAENTAAHRVGSTTAVDMAPLLLQEWETGESFLDPMIESRGALPGSKCGWEDLCFCETHICKLPYTWLIADVLNVSTPIDNTGGRLLQAAHAPTRTEENGGGLLQVAPTTPPLIVYRVQSDQRASVTVAFGLQVTGTAPLLGTPDKGSSWRFMESFDIAQPWGQRNVWKFCANLPDSLRVVASAKLCWMDGFRAWVKVTKREKFPLRKSKFQDLAAEYARTGKTGAGSSKDFMWIRGGNIVATYISLPLDVYKYEETKSALSHMRNWDKHIEEWNADAKDCSKGAWHSSNLWVRSEAQDALIVSTAETLLIVVGLAFAGMLVFTFDFLLSLFVVLASIIVLSFLAFFIIVMMQWPIGPIEVIALIVFTGYAVTYSLHIAHKYGSSHAISRRSLVNRDDLDENTSIRFSRTEFALKSIGGAALGSAATTTGCATFLLFCTLTIFQKLGGVVLAVTIVSILVALIPMPAVLMLAGPLEPGQALVNSKKLLLCRLACCRRRRSPGVEAATVPASTDLATASVASDDGSWQHKGREIALPPSPSSGQPRVMVTVPQPFGMRSNESFGGPLGPSFTECAAGAARLPIPPNDASAPTAEDDAPPCHVEVDDVLLSEAVDHFNIGQESTLEPICSRDDPEEPPNNRNSKSLSTAEAVS